MYRVLLIARCAVLMVKILARRCGEHKARREERTRPGQATPGQARLGEDIQWWEDS